MYEQRYPHPEYDFSTPNLNLSELRVKAKDGQFSEQLLKDFRLSFRFSQGSEKAQHMLIYLLGIQYVQAGPIVRNAVAENLPHISETQWYLAAQPPKEHSLEPQVHLDRESKNEWNKFKKYASPAHITHEIAAAEMTENYGDLLLQLAHFLIRRDASLIHCVRPRLSAPRANASFVREYVLAEEATGSPTFDGLFSDMQRVILAYPPKDISHLATLWTSRHQDQAFYPLSFMKRADDQGTQHLFSYAPGVNYFDPVSGHREFVPVKPSS